MNGDFYVDFHNEEDRKQRAYQQQVPNDVGTYIVWIVCLFALSVVLIILYLTLGEFVGEMAEKNEPIGYVVTIDRDNGIEPETYVATELTYTPSGYVKIRVEGVTGYIYIPYTQNVKVEEVYDETFETNSLTYEQ